MTADVLIPTALVTFAAVVVAYLLGYRDRTTETALADRDVAERVAATIYDALEEWSLTVAETPQDEEIVAARALFLTRRLTGVRLDAVPLDLDLPPASSIELESILDHRDGVHATPCAYPNHAGRSAIEPSDTAEGDPT